MKYQNRHRNPGLRSYVPIFVVHYIKIKTTKTNNTLKIPPSQQGLRVGYFINELYTL